MRQYNPIFELQTPGLWRSPTYQFVLDSVLESAEREAGKHG